MKTARSPQHLEFGALAFWSRKTLHRPYTPLLYIRERRWKRSCRRILFQSLILQGMQNKSSRVLRTYHMSGLLENQVLASIVTTSNSKQSAARSATDVLSSHSMCLMPTWLITIWGYYYCSYYYCYYYVTYSESVCNRGVIPCISQPGPDYSSQLLTMISDLFV